ncbi:MAG: phosphoribosylformimino-5-aminoimidazole carboxamide ribotide isomerase [Victivallales bacterium]|nr:phosphoribosylformimino-5-aminoimidazole carboxamide ribotide isomerase [Victivallales bacterium]
MRFRPCIDLHCGRVKQIVGSSLSDDDARLVTNFVAAEPPSYYANLYYLDGLAGAHVIMLGPGNEEAAREALATRPDFLQVGGGITPANAQSWLDAGAAQVIVTSYLFVDGDFSPERLRLLARTVPRERLVLDLSCRPLEDGSYAVCCDRWTHTTRLRLSRETFAMLGEHCCEFLIHAVAVEGKQSGIDETLVRGLSEWCDLPATYAGGIHTMADIQTIERLGQGRIDFTVGSALDLFGGTALRYAELKKFHG